MQVSNNPTVVIRNVSKRYSLHRGGSEYGLSLRKKPLNVDALKNVSLVAESGESIGVVGQNGSGKSTLFRIISGAESPTNGEVFVSSEPTLLGVSAALQQRLSGVDNVRLGLLAMGLSPSQVSSIKDEVADWSGIGDAVNRPLRTYSSGMRARLVFAISTAVHRDILLIDEALSTGDSAFADRAKSRMESFLEKAGTVFLVSHGAGTVKDYCSRAVWLHHGEILVDGPALEVSSMYVKWSKFQSKGDAKSADSILSDARAAYVEPHIVFDREIVKRLD